jgi:hypothetical protein
VKVYLSVTNQEGFPLESFNHYNFAVVESSSAGRAEIGRDLLFVKSASEDGKSTASSMVMDYSDYMYDSLQGNMENAVKLFIMLMQSGDVAEIVKFAYYPEIVQVFTSNKSDLTAAVEAPWGGATGGSSLIDGIYMGMIDASEREELAAVYALSMGWENSSQHSMAHLRELADSTGIPCYAFGMGMGDTLTLREIADFTGGRFFYVPGLDDPTEMYQILSGMLKKCYVLKWTIQSPSGSDVHLSIATEYTCGNGTLTSTATGVFTAP